MKQISTTTAANRGSVTPNQQRHFTSKYAPYAKPLADRQKWGNPPIFGFIILGGDNDESGTGQKAARAAAVAVGGKYILPATVGHDWNDSLNMEAA